MLRNNLVKELEGYDWKEKKPNRGVSNRKSNCYKSGNTEGKKDYNDCSGEQTPFHREELHENKKRWRKVKLIDSISLFFLWEDKLIIELKNDCCLETNYHDQIIINKGDKSSASTSNTYIPIPTCIQSTQVPTNGLKASREGICRKSEWNWEGTKDYRVNMTEKWKYFI